jgi:uncharacterized protein
VVVKGHKLIDLYSSPQLRFEVLKPIKKWKLCMPTKQEILSYLRTNKLLLTEKFCVATIGLCGSYARDEQREDSDIDFVVEMSEADFFLRMELAEYLAQTFGKKVQVLSRRGLRSLVWDSIEQDIIYA